MNALRIARAESPRCPVAFAFVSAWEADLGEEERRRLVDPLRPRLMTVRSGGGPAEERAAIATDWLVRTWAPAWLELAPGAMAELRALRGSVPIPPSSSDRTRGATSDRAITLVAAGRLAAGNWAWAESRRGDPAHRDAAERVVTAVGRSILDRALGQTGYHAAVAAAARAPTSSRWPALRDHLAGLVLATTSGVAWRAAWDVFGETGTSEAVWANACRTRVVAQIEPIKARLESLTSSLARRILAA
jgi:hypothetical protein